jgi:hypothetical protein
VSVKALTCAMALRGVAPSEKLLLLALANYADENMQCYPSQKRLAEDTCLSDRTIRTLLASLEERRIISREERQRRDNSRATDLVTLHFFGGVAEAASGGAEIISATPAETISGGLRKPLPGGAEMASALTTFEPSLNHQSEPDDGERASAPDWSNRLDEAKLAGGEALDLTSPSLHTFRDLKALCEPASGEPCEWGEVLDAIRFRAARWQARGGPRIRSWTWVSDQAQAYRDRRLAGLRAPEAVAQGPPSFADQIAAHNAEARRRVLEG